MTNYTRSQTFCVYFLGAIVFAWAALIVGSLAALVHFAIKFW